MVSEERVTEIVVGLPLSLSGESSAQTEQARAFAAELERRLGLSVHTWDERLSTREAMRLARPEAGRRPGRRDRRPAADTDAIAASLVLQAFLDARRFDQER
jgi:putative holliday junction resolvase